MHCPCIWTGKALPKKKETGCVKVGRTNESVAFDMNRKWLQPLSERIYASVPLRLGSHQLWNIMSIARTGDAHTFAIALELGALSFILQDPWGV